MNIKEFIESLGLTMDVIKVDCNPFLHPDNENDYKYTDHYKCTIHYSAVSHNITHKKAYVTYFTKWNETFPVAPSIEEVMLDVRLNCLDIEPFHNVFCTVDTWAANHYYDAGLNTVVEIFNECMTDRNDVLQFLGNDYYNTLLWDYSAE